MVHERLTTMEFVKVCCGKEGSTQGLGPTDCINTLHYRLPRKLNDIGGTPRAKELPSSTQSRSANHILEKIDECWPLRESLNGTAHRTRGP